MTQDRKPQRKSQAYLMDALHKEAFPFLLSKGFLQDKINRMGAIDFRRIVNDKVECLDIQLDKHGRAAFKVNIAEGSINGVPQFGGGMVLGAELRTYTCKGDKAILMERPNVFLTIASFGFYGWFSVRRGWFLGAEEAAFRTIRCFINYFPECENWWRDKSYGPHLLRNKGSEQLERVLEQRYGPLN